MSTSSNATHHSRPQPPQEQRVWTDSDAAVEAQDHFSLLSTTLVGSKAWDVVAPPPSNSFTGSIVPSGLALRHKRRRISLEVHRFPILEDVVAKSKKEHEEHESQPREGIDFYEECIVRFLVPEKRKIWSRRSGGTATDSVTSAVSSYDDETTNMMRTSEYGIDPAGSPEYPGWKTKYRVPIRKFTPKPVEGNIVPCVMQVDVHRQSRELIFHSEQKAWEFYKYIEYQKRMEERRAPIRLQAQLGSVKSELSSELTLLVEIVSAWNLPGGSIDPFVRCYFDGKEVHRTKPVLGTSEPIFTVQSGSLFLLTCTVRKLFSCEGLICEVGDLAQFGAYDKLGAVTISSRILYQATGQRLEFKLSRAQGQSRDHRTGMFAIRCRRASEYDIKFVQSLKNQESETEEGDEEQQSEFQGITEAVKKGGESEGGKNFVKSIVTRYKKTEGFGANRQVKYLVRPCPDPERPKETTWLTKAQLELEVERESFHWLDSGNGSLGCLFVEVLGCNGLPNVDRGGQFGSKSDAIVAIVFEDTMMKTDIIDDSLNPRWPPWSKRAFVFHILHPSSQLYLGIFDFATIGEYNFIGRVAVELTNLRPDTTYTLSYDIFPTASLLSRKQQGSITIRLRIDIGDERKMLLSILRPPPKFYVNVNTKKDFQVIRYTCLGNYDVEAYNMKVINNYIEELLAHKHLLYFAKDSLLSLLVWRGNLPVSIGKRTIWLPLHSAVAFIAGVFLVEHPSKIPSFFCALMAWIMLATMSFRRTFIPNPWRKCLSFFELSQTLALGRSISPPDSIQAFERADEARAFKEMSEKRLLDAENAARLAREEMKRRREEELKELEEAGGVDTDMSTKFGGKSLLFRSSPFDTKTYQALALKGYLYPVQQQLGTVCKYLRITRHVVTWTESYVAFWFTLTFLVLSLVFYVIPWFFLIRWVTRIVVWTALGPWMKLVDIFYLQKKLSRTEKEKERLALGQRVFLPLTFQSNMRGCLSMSNM